MNTTNTTHLSNRNRRFHAYRADAKVWRESAKYAEGADAEFRKAMAEIFTECADHAGTVNVG